MLFVVFSMARKTLFYCNGYMQGTVDDVIVGGLDDLYNVEKMWSLNRGKMNDIAASVSGIGLLTHFPANEGGANPNLDKMPGDMYAGAVDLLHTIRRNRPNLPILVYTGAGVGAGASGLVAMRDIIIGAGANDVVFKDEPHKDIVTIREKLVELLN